MPAGDTARGLVPLAIALLAAALYAATFGFLSTDSWNYLAMAQSLRHGDGCAVDGRYFAVFPCGYAALIAATSWSSDLVALIAGSKLLNLVLFLSAAALIRAQTRHWAATLVFALNPISLLLLLYTWSEGLMLFAIAGALLAIKRCAERPEAAWRNTALLSFFLILGCAARYVFAPFAVALALGVALCYGRAVLWRTLPGFGIAALFAGAYAAFNWLQTGHMTGMPRVPAPEAAGELVAEFVAVVLRQSLDAAVLIAILAAVGFGMTRRRTFAWQPMPEAALLAVAGLFYLALAFVLRLLVLFDPYNARTVGPGMVLVGSGLAAMLLARDVGGPWLRRAALTTAALIHAAIVTIGTGTLAKQARYAAATGAWPVLAVARVLDTYGAKNLPADSRAVVSFGVEVFPEPMRIGWNARLYYPARITLIEAGQPTKESAEAFAGRLRDSASVAGCYFDFTIFRSDAALRAWVEREFDPAVAARLIEIGAPGQYIPCARYGG